MKQTFSNILYGILYYLIQYRRKVVHSNIKSTFPDHTERNIQEIEKAFYHYLSNLIIETFLLSWYSSKKLLKKINISNFELLESFLEKGSSCFILTAHYQNWEFAGTALGVKTNDRVAAVFKPLKNKWFNKFIVKTRTKFGSILVSMHDIKKIISLKEKNVAIYMVADQTPANLASSHWVKFLNRETAFFQGAEKMAKKMNLPVLYAHVDKPNKDRYELRLELITDTPQSTENGWITERYASILEQKIKENPPYWLWSHKRWKLSPTE